MALGSAQQSITPAVLNRAVQWWLIQQEGEMNARTQQRFKQWLSENEAHYHAWQRVSALSAQLDLLPEQAVRHILDRADNGRRKALSQLALLALVGVGGVGYWGVRERYWGADWRSAVGEQRDITLDPYTQIVLNTDSAIDWRVDAKQRELRLWQGEIQVHDHGQAKQPLRVRTQQAVFTPLGTIFTLRQFSDHTVLSVQRDRVRITTNAGIVRTATKGAVVKIDAENITLLSADQAQYYATWTHGMLIADELPLAQVAAELSRYRRGRIMVDDALHQMPISGVYPLNHPEQALSMLATVYDLHIESSLFGYVISIK